MSEYYTQTQVLSSPYAPNATSFNDYNQYAIGDVDIQGTRLFVSAPSIESGLEPSIHVYDLNESTDQWTLTTTITSDIVKDLGRTISVYDDTLVVGAFIGSNKGCVIIYNQQTSSTWSTTQIISSNNNTHNFGECVSIYDDTLIVGDIGYDNNKGRVLVYTKSGSTWAYSTTITASDAADTDYFGIDAHLDQNTLAVGARNGDGNELSNSGCVYIYTRSGNNWTQSTKIHADDAAQWDQFGTSVSLSGTRLVVGAIGVKQTVTFPDDTTGTSNIGAVYIFDKQTNGNWTQTTKISGHIVPVEDSSSYNTYSNGRTQFGKSVDTDGARLVVGSHAGDIAFYEGVAYVYTLSGGTTVSTAQAIGDPHMVTFDGTKYTL